MSVPIGLPAALPTSAPASPGAQAMLATASDAMLSTYGASATDQILQVASATDSLLTTAIAVAIDRPGR
jgi:hypothetical protein